MSGEAGANLWARYSNGKLEAKADVDVLLKLVFALCFDARAWAEAGVWKFKVSTYKNWHLGHFVYDPNLRLGMKMNKPMVYSSDTGLNVQEALKSIEWIKPSFDAEHALKSSFNQDSGQESSEPVQSSNPCPKVYKDD